MATTSIIPDRSTATGGTALTGSVAKQQSYLEQKAAHARHSAKQINNAARTQELTLQSVSAAEQVIPVLYGYPLYLGVRLAGIVESAGNLHLLGVLGYGELTRIDAAYVDDVAVNVTPPVGRYYGTAAQPVDSVIKAAYATKGVTFTDAMHGIAYVRVTLTSAMALQSAPNLAVKCGGKKVLDMRTGTTAESSNPVLCLADFIASNVYGMGAVYDDASFSAAANFCDEATADGPRYRIALALTEAHKVDDWLAQLVAYTGCVLWRKGGVYFLTPLRARAATINVDKSQIVEGTFEMGLRAQRELPTRVSVAYTEWATFPPATRTASQQNDASADDERESKVTLPGVTSYAMASRIAGRRLNAIWYGQLTANWRAFDSALNYRPGDVLTLTFHDYGLDNAEFAVTQLTDQGFGRWAVEAETYSADSFSDVALPPPPIVDTGELVPPTNLAPALTGPITVEEQLEQFGNGDFRSQLLFSWPETPDTSILAYYGVVLQDVTDAAHPTLAETNNVPVAAYVSGWLTDSRIYRLSVVAVGITGLASTLITSADVLVLGKTAPPANVTNFVAIEAGGNVYCSWAAVPDLDRDEYEIRRGAVGAAWSTMVPVTKLHATNTVLASQPLGVVDFAIKAKDTSGNYSVTEARATVTVTQDQNVNVTGPAPFTGYTTSSNVSTFGTPPLSMVNTDLAGYWQDGADVPDNTVGTFNDSLRDVVIAYPSDDAAWIQTTPLDFGVIINTQVSVSMPFTLLAGAAGGVSALIETSTDNVTYTALVAGEVRNVRYVRARMNIAAGTIIRTRQEWSVSLITVLISEYAKEKVGASGKATVTLTNRYAAWVSIQVTALSSTNATATYDNVIVGPSAPNTFDVWIFKANAPAAGNASWTFRGVR